MSATVPAQARSQGRYTRLIIAVLFGVVALAVLTLVYTYFYRWSCSTVAYSKFCHFSRLFAERSLSIGALAMIYGLTHADRVRPILSAALRPGPLLQPLAVGVAGVLLAVLTALSGGMDAQGPVLLMAMMAWVCGVAIAALAGFRLIAPWQVWRNTLVSGGAILPIFLIIGLILPEAGRVILPIWHLEWLRVPTFDAVVWVSGIIGLDLVTTPENFTPTPDQYVIGQGSFFVDIGHGCSGIEGFVLITVFLTGYGLLFWRQLSVLRVLAILPLGLALSWVLNVVRISTLIWIGVNVSPELAVEGFHSHAGWLSFTLLALGLITFVHLVPWFHAKTATAAEPAQQSAAAPVPPLSADWNAARILPFAVFMFSALVASTFFATPALAYPLRLLAMLAALWVFRDFLIALPWRLDRWAVGLGVGIGVAWVLTAPAPGAADTSALKTTLEAYGTLALLGWAAARVIGTVIAVPIIEELFFRSYLLDRLGASRSLIGLGLALVVSTAAFAALHDRWLAGALAGLIFAWLTLRPNGRLTDAIIAHVLANAVIAAAAAWYGDWSMI